MATPSQRSRGLIKRDADLVSQSSWPSWPPASAGRSPALPGSLAPPAPPDLQDPPERTASLDTLDHEDFLVSRAHLGCWVAKDPKVRRAATKGHVTLKDSLLIPNLHLQVIRATKGTEDPPREELKESPERPVYQVRT